MADRGTLRRAIGTNLGALSSAAILTVDSTTLSHSFAPAWGSDKRGHRVWYNDQESTVVNAGGTGEDGTLTIDPAFDTVTAGEEVELWLPTWAPSTINRFVNQGILEAIRKVYLNKPVLYRCITPHNLQFELGGTVATGLFESGDMQTTDGIAMVTEVYTRRAFDFNEIYYIHDWEVIPFPGDTAKTRYDYSDFRFQPSTRVELNDLGGGTVTIGTTISERDFSGMTHVEGWFKTLVDRTVTISLRDGSTEQVNFEINLKAAEGWTYVRQKLPSPEKLATIDGVRLTTSTGGTPAMFWVNGLWTVDDQSVMWEKMVRRMWRIDRETRSLQIKPNYSLMYTPNFPGRSLRTSFRWPVEDVVRIIVGGDPVQMDADDDETEVMEQFLIARGTQLAFGSVSGGPQTDPRRFRQQAILWEDQARMALARFTPLVNVRRLT